MRRGQEKRKVVRKQGGKKRKGRVRQERESEREPASAQTVWPRMRVPRACSVGRVWQMRADPGSSLPCPDVSLGYRLPSDNSHHLWSLHRVLVWRGVPMRIARHVAVGGHTDTLGRGRNVPHRRQRRRAWRQGR